MISPFYSSFSLKQLSAAISNIALYFTKTLIVFLLLDTRLTGLVFKLCVTMKLTDEILSRFFLIIDPDVIPELTFSDVADEFTDLQNSIDNEPDKTALSYLLWQLFVEQRWTPTLESKLGVIFLLFNNNLCLPGYIQTLISNSYLKAYLEEVECYSEVERHLMGRLSLDNGNLPEKLMMTKLGDRICIEFLDDVDDKAKLQNAFERVKQQVEQLHILEKGIFQSVIPSTNDFTLNKDNPQHQTALKQLRHAYFLRIGGQDNGPLFRFFTPELINVRPYIFNENKEIIGIIPDIFDFTELIWDNSLDEVVCEIPFGRDLLQKSAQELLKPEEHHQLLEWLKIVLAPLNKCRLLYREPRLFQLYGLDYSTFVLLSSFNPILAFEILKYAICQYNMLKYVYTLIDSLSTSRLYPNDKKSIANRFDIVLKLYFIVSMPKSFCQLFIASSIYLCTKSRHLHKTIGRKLCIFLLDVMNISHEKTTTPDDVIIIRSVWQFFKFFAVQIRSVKEAAILYQVVTSEEAKGTKQSTKGCNTQQRLTDTDMLRKLFKNRAIRKSLARTLSVIEIKKKEKLIQKKAEQKVSKSAMPSDASQQRSQSTTIPSGDALLTMEECSSVDITSSITPKSSKSHKSNKCKGHRR
ncbi:hypothetical protein GJ496_011106 [Pomphorhynchus laevis]|nr:hypothetical protein GJ496_011106 [Pomphorhynchus laevis]